MKGRLFYEDPVTQLWLGGSLDVLAEMPAESVSGVGASPPY